MIWIVGGTKDSRDILQKLVEEKREDNIIVSTATAYGGELLKKYTSDETKNIQAISEKLNEEQMKELIKDKNISLIIDASHPYAINVSNSVIKVTEELGIKYVRFERKMLDYGTENVVKFDTLEEINDYVRQFEGKNILSTMGSNNLGEIKEMSEKNNLYVRILPTVDSVKKAEDLGYLPSKIIAIQGPVSKVLNKAMLESYKIDYLITKESGATGGEIEKIEACREYGTTVLVVKRPYVNYGKVYNEINELVEDVKNKVL
mgnify:CR=1 FL=1